MSRSRVGFNEREYRRDDVGVRVRDRERESDFLPSFLREERRPEQGPLVLRSREIEERVRRRSPSPVRTRIIERARSVSPFPQRRTDEDVRFRTIERVRAPSRGPDLERLRTRILSRNRSSSPSSFSSSSDDERTRTRIVSRHRSPSRERIRIVEHEKQRARSPSPAPPPPVVKAPTVEREVITHLRTIDHGVVAVRPPSPPPPPRRKERDTEIDIYTSRSQTEVDIHKRTRSRGRSRSRSRERMTPAHVHAWDDGVLVHADRRHLHVDIEAHRSHSRTRRAHSAAPIYHDYDDEAREITSKIDARGKMGEAWNGITKDWTIVDVPPGTERVRMDGAGGASAEVTWQKYSGVRRSKFIPDRDDRSSVVSSSSVSDREHRHEHGARESRLSVQIYDKDSREIDIEKVTDRRVSIHHPPPPRRSEMWTEITKDLVIREAIEEMGYEYEETEWFFYIMTYLRYEDVLQLVQLSDAVRRARKERVHEIQWEREYYDELNRERSHRHHRRHKHRGDESTVEVSYEKRSSRYR